MENDMPEARTQQQGHADARSHVERSENAKRQGNQAL